MNLFHVVEKVFLRLSVVPGLGFLHEYVHEMETRKTERQQVVSKYRSYVQAVRGAASVTSEAAHGTGEHGSAKHGPAKRGPAQDGPAQDVSAQHAKDLREDCEDENDEDEDYDDFESYML